MGEMRELFDKEKTKIILEYVLIRSGGVGGRISVIAQPFLIMNSIISHSWNVYTTNVLAV